MLNRWLLFIFNVIRSQYVLWSRTLGGRLWLIDSNQFLVLIFLNNQIVTINLKLTLLFLTLLLLHGEFLERLQKICSHFESYIGFGLTKVDEITPGTPKDVCPVQRIYLPCLLMLWRLKEPGHQHGIDLQRRNIPSPASKELTKPPLKSRHGQVITFITNCGMKLLTHSQTL